MVSLCEVVYRGTANNRLTLIPVLRSQEHLTPSLVELAGSLPRHSRQAMQREGILAIVLTAKPIVCCLRDGLCLTGIRNMPLIYLLLTIAKISQYLTVFYVFE